MAKLKRSVLISLFIVAKGKCFPVFAQHTIGLFILRKR